jgi:hypothetical protein
VRLWLDLVGFALNYLDLALVLQGSFSPPRGVLGRTGRTVVPRPDLPRLPAFGACREAVPGRTGGEPESPKFQAQRPGTDRTLIANCAEIFLRAEGC